MGNHSQRPAYWTFLLVALMGMLLPSDAVGADARATVPIVVAPGRQQESAAASELAGLLAKVYPNAEFQVQASPPGPAASGAIYLGTKDSEPQLLDGPARQNLDTPGSFVVFTRRGAGPEAGSAGCIVGADLDGLYHGIYGLLRKLGYGFYLSFDTLPEHSLADFSFDGWQLEDRPLVPVRLVFNWHNFLSGCSTWELADWQRWIAQSQKLGYNGVMVHAYGNNPMAGFKFRGVQKPVGYLSSTRVGRDWSTNHVNDVRRLFDGEVFAGPVFGCRAAIEGTDAERTAAAQKLMAGAFASAEQRGVDVYFAVDVDTTSANPQELIRRLPASARFSIDVPSMDWMGQKADNAWLANPDTPEGYAFYKAQVRQLLTVYPQIDCLVVWHRTRGTPWMAFPRESMPESWQEEYGRELAKTPEAEKLWHAEHMFAQAKIVRAFQQAVGELGRGDVKIAFGSWGFDFMPAADRFLPEGVALVGLDYGVLHDQSQFDSPKPLVQQSETADVASRRPVIPISWAQHDDGNYVGRSYTPYSSFYDRLAAMGCRTSGFGIIHWTTKPLDLYFASLVDQVWSTSKNEPLETTCRRMAADCLGEDEAEPFGRYLQLWITTMPKIGRETSDFFIDHELGDLPGVEAGFRNRMKLLDAVAGATLKPGGRQWLDYFKGLERYILDIYRNEDAFTRAKQQYVSGDLAAARKTVAQCKPEEVIRQYARFSQCGGLTRGEQGLIVSMNTRWLPHYVRFRQQLGLDAVRLDFAATSHDLLAQSPGIYTFHFDPEKRVWQTLGTQETGAPVFTLPGDVAVVRPDGVTAAEAEICRSGIESDAPLELAVEPIVGQTVRRKKYDVPGGLPAGQYRLSLLMLDPEFDAPGQRVFGVSLTLVMGKRKQPAGQDRIDVARGAGGRNRVLKKSYPLDLPAPGTVQLTLTPVKGKAILCGVVLEPVDLQD